MGHVWRPLLALAFSVVLLAAGCGGGSGAATGESGGAPGPWFRSERPPTAITDTQEEATAYKLGARDMIACRVATYEASLRSKSERLPLHLRFRGCRSAEGTVRIDTGGCTYILEASPRGQQTPISISCPEGESIAISLAGGCTLELGSQTPQGGVAYTTTGRGAKRSFDANAEVSAVSYETVGGAGCDSVGTGRDIAISFGIELYGFEDRPGGAPVGLWVEQPGKG